MNTPANWKPNPVIRSQVAHELRRAAAQYVGQALRVVTDVMVDKAVAPEIRLKAAAIIFDRAAGKPSQEMILDTPDTEQLRTMMEKAIAHTNTVINLPLARPTATVIDLPVKKKRKRLKTF